jgi:Viral BACON domain
VVDALAAQYAGRAVFVEQNVDTPAGDRISRFWAAFSAGTAYLPLVLADSGHRLLTGDQPAIALQSAVNSELARPPLAEIRAWARRAGGGVRVYATLRNTSGTTLSDANHATLFALVYEDVRVGVTGRFVLAAPLLNLTVPVPAGGYVNATLNTPALTGASWDVLHTVVAADYVPGPGTAYDMLQAAVAGPADLSVTPSAATVGVDSAHPADRSVPVTLDGPYPLSWTAVPDVPWLTVTPATGPMSTAPALVVSAAQLASGSQEGHVTFSASSEDGMAFTRFATVTAVLGPRVVEARAPAVTPGAELALAVEVTALGDEHAVAFSLAFDPAFLGDPAVTAGGAAAGATVTTDLSQVAAGRLGVTVTLPPGQTLAGGTAEVAVVTFTAAESVPRQNTSVSFADAPVARTLADAFGGALPATFTDAALRFPWWSAPHVIRRHLAAR